MYDKFIKMIKIQDDVSIEDFYSSVDELKQSSINEDFVSTIERISVTKSDIHDILEDIEKYMLDPSIPSLFKDCVELNKNLSEGILY
ncbi:hypothetical protein OR235_004580 [Enterobacter cloacae]|nr:hypothetical protein [Enterobacter cloacae]